MRHRARVTPRRRAVSAVLAVLSLCTTALSVSFALGGSAPADVVGSSPQFSQTKTVTRDNLVDGQDQLVDSRAVTVTADATAGLRDGSAVNITWSGARPTAGVFADNQSQYAAEQEYPVAVLQCRGVDSPTAGQQQVTPDTCFTQTPELRYQSEDGYYVQDTPTTGHSEPAFPAYRVDRYATQADRQRQVDEPSPRPAACVDEDPSYGAERWVPFDALNGTQYYNGPFGCGQLAPEQAQTGNSLQPSNTVWGATDLSGNGSARFLVQSSASNASLGCSISVACSIVVIPIMGISCDAQGQLVPQADRPADPARAYAECSQTGHYPAGAAGSNDASAAGTAQLPVTGELWWSASNWRNRITIPMTFSPTANDLCQGTSASGTAVVYGSEALLQATQQWAPGLCTDTPYPRLNHVELSEPAAKNQLANGLSNGSYGSGVEAAFQAAPPDEPFSNPVVQAPTAVTGFGIAYLIDDQSHHAYTSLKLDARLLAKLLTMSYPDINDVRNYWASCCGSNGNASPLDYAAAANNPLNLSDDPEFLALNPGLKLPSYGVSIDGAATLMAMSSSSDLMTALTSYINSDPDARAWLDGTPDPWGMVVNPAYKGIQLPTDTWPQLDTLSPASLANSCVTKYHSAYLPLVAAPLSEPATIAAYMQLGISTSQTNCDISQPDSPQLKSVGRQGAGNQFLLGLVSLGDAERDGLDLASLETQKSSAAADQFTDTSGRSFAAPSTASLQAAAAFLTPDANLQTWTLPYDKLRTDPAGAAAYPGTVLVSTDVPTQYLAPADANRYASLLSFLAGPGQASGIAAGQLPAGYLPITAANGLGALAAYTSAAAAAVSAQAGAVPSVTGSAPAASSSAAPVVTQTTEQNGTPLIVIVVGGVKVSPSHSDPGGSAAAQPTPVASAAPDQAIVDAPQPQLGSTSDRSVTPAHAATSRAGTSGSPIASQSPAVLLGKTVDRGSGPLGLTLPALLILALISGLGSLWFGGAVRR